MAIDKDRPFVVETDASQETIFATINQDGKPVAFFSRSLQSSQKSYPSLEKRRLL